MPRTRLMPLNIAAVLFCEWICKQCFVYFWELRKPTGVCCDPLNCIIVFIRAVVYQCSTVDSLLFGWGEGSGCVSCMEEDKSLCNGDDDGSSGNSKRRLQRCATRKEQLFTEISRSISCICVCAVL